MLNYLVRTTLGPWGSAVLDFYLANSLWINGIIMLLVLGNVLGSRTYFAIFHQLKKQLMAKGLDLQKGSTVAAMEKILTKGDVAWGELSKTGWFPLINVPGHFFPVMKNPANLEKFFNADYLIKIVDPKGKSRLTGKLS
jgi:hypothetical protein